MISTDQFCNLGDMLSTGGDTKASTISHIRSGWKTFRELLPRLKSTAFSRRMKKILYTACIRSNVLNGRGIWPLKESDISRIFQG